MNWERIESARNKARFLLALPWLVIAFLVFAVLRWGPLLRPASRGG